ncbi:MAG: hypothetical protein A2370_00505 [Candidatus Vogelbacteria bacterium RIFOXYB1_FULL_42_16]|uniref:DUF5652 domain-containing protein n=1 Tax=Candidatus Vogelbacteria bacterium RIFOXYB1_FULL_42_16 TaxID=1802436 RepID=A0A1G2QDX7_9BACT|nr:MAG: hypothetical protein A2370_00505 [Candidatus Vogelbacteria bacterium RIFOXYB1_FULL_42_16]
MPPEVWGISALFGAVGATTFLVALIIWTLVWKGLALWKAARHGDKWWFIALLVINTIGLLDIIYYFLVRRKKK